MVKVVYILAWGRSGTTLLDNLLGEVPGFFSGGEIRFLWKRGLRLGWRCGCGSSLTECEVWSQVLTGLRNLFPKMNDPAAFEEIQQRYLRIRHIPRLLKTKNEDLVQHPALHSYASLMTTLYEQLAEVTSSRVIVDSSKRPSDAALLRLLPGVEPYLIHVIRDPRGVAYSWSKTDNRLAPHSLWTSTLSWNLWNLAGEALRAKYGRERTLLVRYEDFVKHPSATLELIATMVDEHAQKLPSPERDASFRFGINHTVSGNPSRFRRGEIRLRLDDQWMTHMSPVRKAAVTCMSLPLLRRYGYALKPKQETDLMGSSSL
jgi:hypothetical protein